jgi:hypothetical protein
MKKYFHVNGLWRATHVNDVRSSYFKFCDNGLGFHRSMFNFSFFIKRKIYYRIIYGHMHDLTAQHRDLFISKLKFSTVKIAFPYISLFQTTNSIFHRYRQITSFSQKFQKPKKTWTQIPCIFLFLFGMEMFFSEKYVDLSSLSHWVRQKTRSIKRWNRYRKIEHEVMWRQKKVRACCVEPQKNKGGGFDFKNWQIYIFEIVHFEKNILIS